MSQAPIPPSKPRPYNSYQAAVSKLAFDQRAQGEVWTDVYDWYQSKGRAQFIESFRHETGITVNPNTDPDNRFGAALPDSPGDYGKKVQGEAYYRAHAELFLIEMDHVMKQVPRESTDPMATSSYMDLMLYLRGVLLDSTVLFTHWGSRAAQVPGVFMSHKNEHTHLVGFYHGALQTVYGHGTWGLSMVENHSELAVATIRQAVEIRLRRAFGLIGKTSRRDGSFHPVAISELLDVVSDMKAVVKTPISFDTVKRINSWANIFLHSGMRHYAWVPPTVVRHLRPLLVGGDAPGGRWTVDAGVQLKRASFDAVRDTVRARIEAPPQGQSDPHFDALLLDPEDCDVVFV